MIEGHERRPIILSAWHHPYYRPLLESYGLQKTMDWLMWSLHISGKSRVRDAIWRMAANVETEHGIVCRPMRKRDRAVVVEGYFDHLALVAAGIEETVASMGTALPPEQAAKLRRLAPTVVVCYDGDPAGRAATRGALSHLLAEGFSARVVRLPPGRDPHDVLRAEGPERLAARIEEAPDYLTWLLEDANPQEPGLSSAEKSGSVPAGSRP